MDNFMTSNDPIQLLNFALDELKIGITQSNHSFRTGCFATVYENSPHIRTVVLRDFKRNGNTLYFHSDNRSKKNDHLNKNSKSSLLFYSQELKLQIRFNGNSKIVDDQKELATRFDESKPQSKVCYGFNIAPSSPINVQKKELLEPTILEPLNKEQLSFAFKNFSVIKFVADECEVLYLHHDGHIKVFNKFFAKEWHSQFVCA